MPRDGPLFGIIILIMCSKVKKRYCCCHVVQALSSNICTFEATEHIYGLSLQRKYMWIWSSRACMNFSSTEYRIGFIVAEHIYMDL